MAVVKVTSENYDEIKNSEKTVLLDFYADWCGPCKMVSPIVDQAAQFGVMSIPCLVAMKGGEVVTKKVGVQPKEGILAMLG